MEDLIIKKLNGGLLGMKIGTKQPNEVAPWLNKLKTINPHMYEDYLIKYKEALKKLNKN